MQRIFIYLLLSFLISSTYDAVAQYKFQINGHITNSSPSLKFSKHYFKNGDTVFLQFINLKKVDTAIVKNTSFKFSDDLPYPSIAMVEHKHGGSLILLDNSVYNFELKIDTVKGVYEPEVKTQSNFFNLKKKFDKIKTNLYNNRNNYSNLLNKSKNADSILFYNTEIKVIDKDIAAAYKKFASENPNSYLTAYLIPAAPNFSYDGYIDTYNTLSDEIKRSFYGKNFKDLLKASQSIQSVNKNEDKVNLPTILAIDTSYKKVTIDTVFFKKHKYTLIEFGASWCIPCKKMNKELRQKLPALKNKDMVIIEFSLDNTFSAWKKGVETDKLNWLQVSDLKATNSPIAKFLNITAVPTNVIVNSEGLIIKKDVYGQDLDDFLKSIN
ncbi:thioredoxin-like domain-containing protein [Mucilaginibacter phyllosphaerae]|uniref:Redoxin domain-containing protein n=1 Tax=Mucilaginibacter phyllosphaerae TaxID=1812349 RepID=A0A4Y8AHT2_9SPHI|nr:thioredoxin-like domain-containing protein [Mucilaginibacter phyllosphaerae]MBB3968368.1 thiol-disulfide isomerase/thioredoxin [Mucilaginibacter phyllosphaerae]TEW68634.1 redoxin domain-containing protein [Mucilaginibacter phyllosphaerae]GGG99423.1 hypothetical protein GCM10007352_00240 [Mucilaginibacter phyllosphaerae]